MAFKKYKAIKDPDSYIDYGRAWGKFLKDDEIIIESDWIIASDDEDIPTLTVNASGISSDGKDTFVWLSGGTVEVQYNLLNRITTDKTRIEDRTGIITVGEK